jgi:hypothetical protein
MKDWASRPEMGAAIAVRPERMSAGASITFEVGEFL